MAETVRKKNLCFNVYIPFILLSKFGDMMYPKSGKEDFER